LVMDACDHHGVKLSEWVSSWQFANDADVIEFTGQKGKKEKKRMLPDSFFSVVHKGRELRYMVEIDTGSEQNYKVVHEKILPTPVYISSDAYKRRFGHNSGRRIVITDGERRAKKLKERTEVALGKYAQWILITTFDVVNADT